MGFTGFYLVFMGFYWVLPSLFVFCIRPAALDLGGGGIVVVLIYGGETKSRASFSLFFIFFSLPGCGSPLKKARTQIMHSCCHGWEDGRGGRVQPHPATPTQPPTHPPKKNCPRPFCFGSRPSLFGFGSGNLIARCAINWGSESGTADGTIFVLCVCLFVCLCVCVFVCGLDGACWWSPAEWRRSAACAGSWWPRWPSSGSPSTFASGRASAGQAKSAPPPFCLFSRLFPFSSWLFDCCSLIGWAGSARDDASQ